jgi:hypothetical protein
VFIERNKHGRIYCLAGEKETIMAKGTFVTAVNCMDGRVQEPMINWAKNKFGVDYVDMITEPGPDKIVSEGEPEQVASVRFKTEISVEKHKSEIVIIMGHDDCAGNPVPKEKHVDQIKAAMRIIKSWGFPVTIHGVWMDINWNVEVIDTIEK